MVNADTEAPSQWSLAQADWDYYCHALAPLRQRPLRWRAALEPGVTATI